MIEFYYWFQFLQEFFSNLFGYYDNVYFDFPTAIGQLASYVCTYSFIALLIIIPLAVIYRIIRSLFSL